MSENTERDQHCPERVLMDWMDENNVRLIGSTPAMLVSVLRSAGHMDLTDSDALMDDAKDTLIAAGYRKPRTIATVEELDALPEGSLILDSDPDVLVKRKGRWRSPDYPDDSFGPASITFPVTVLHTPEATL